MALWYGALSGPVIPNCWRQVASAQDLLNQARPPVPSFFCCLSAQTGRSSEANHHSGSASPLSPVVIISKRRHPVLCHHGNSRPPLWGVQQGNEKRKNSHGLNRSWSRATSEVANVFLPILWKGRLRKGSGSPAFLWTEEQNVKPDDHTHGGHSAISTNKQKTTERVDALVFCRWAKRSIDIYFNVQNTALLTTSFAHFFQTHNSYFNVCSIAFPGLLTCGLSSLVLLCQLHFFQKHPFSFKRFLRDVLLSQKTNNLV